MGRAHQLGRAVVVDARELAVGLDGDGEPALSWTSETALSMWNALAEIFCERAMSESALRKHAP